MGLSMQHYSPAALVIEAAMHKGEKINYFLYLSHLTET